MTTTLDLDVLEKLALEATPGWYRSHGDREPRLYGFASRGVARATHPDPLQREADITYILACAPEKILALIAYARHRSPLAQAHPATLSESGGAGPTLQSKGSNR